MKDNKQKRGIRAAIREIFEMLPLPVNYLISIFLLILSLTSLVPDSVPLFEEIIFIYLTFVSFSVLKEKQSMSTGQREIRRTSLKQEKGLRKYEDKMKKIFTLFRQIKKALLKYRDSRFLQAERERFNALLPKVEKIRDKIQNLDTILQSPEFQEHVLENELEQLSRDLSDVDSDREHEELKTAREHAERCMKTVKNLKQDRNLLVARIEKFYYILKETHSKIVAMDLTEEEVSEDISRDINRLLESLDSFDQAMKELGSGVTTKDPLLDDLALPGDEKNTGSTDLELQ